MSDIGPDPYANLESSTSALAFGAYHDAWLERQTSGDGSERRLVDALRERGVPMHEVAPGSLLRETLWESWAENRDPSRMHLTILRFRVRQVLRAPRELVDIFRTPVPRHLRVPDDVRRISRHGAADEGLVLPFTPGATFESRLRATWDHLATGDDADLPVWLDPFPSGHRAFVMLGRERIGEVTLPADVHAHLVAGPTTRKGVRLVADGTLLVTRDRDGRFRADEVDLLGTPEV